MCLPRAKYINMTLNIETIFNTVFMGGTSMFISLNDMEKLTSEELMMVNIISKMLRKYKILCGFAANNPSVLKFEPPLIVKKEEIDYFIECLDKLLDEDKTQLTLAIDTLISTGKGLIENYTSGS